MSGLASISSFGAVASTAQLQAAFQVQAAVKQNEVAADLGTSALKLIQSALVLPESTGNDLDVRA
ncbi:MAG: hypothetical protein COA73_08770 [Candidatus Hydrogenedentota bacterium]|nr:MAG: hypothetical protein COA73_08770 [Candidatus Hydrogenedentota bacterium]